MLMIVFVIYVDQRNDDERINIHGDDDSNDDDGTYDEWNDDCENPPRTFFSFFKLLFLKNFARE